MFVSGPEFLEVLFMVMAIMKTAAQETDIKKLVDLVPLLKAWAVVAKHEMAFFSFVTFPFKRIIKATAGLTSSKAQRDHLEEIEKVTGHLYSYLSV